MVTNKSFLQRIRPSNLVEEKAKFLFDQNYNPQFEYDDPVSAEELLAYSTLDDDLIDVAKTILNKVDEEFPTEQDYIRASAGKLMKHEDAMKRIHEYLEDNELTETVQVETGNHFNSRTSVYRQERSITLQIRTPTRYREFSLESMLYHEVGTHIFRWINEMQQPWFQQHHTYGLAQNVARTEEGLASIHGLIPRQKKYLWSQALLYFASYEATQNSFAQLNKILKKYISDPELRWRYCYRVKRGVQDTSTTLAFTKSQIYLQGTVTMLSWLQSHDVQSLYLGKIAAKDTKLAQKLRSPDWQPVLPEFVQNKEAYQAHVKEIIRVNQLKKFL